MKGMIIDEVHQKIKNMIYHNQLAPGQKLVLGDLAERIGVSATPIVQVLNRLKASDLVEYKANKGYFVGEITETEARQLYEAREALETYIIPFVIRNLDSDEVKNIREEFKKYKEENRREMILRDAQFHLKIAEYAKNDVIYKLLKDIFERIYLKYRPEYLTDTRIKELIKEHRMMLDALQNRDEEKSIALTRQHIHFARDYVVNGLSSKKIPFL